MNTKVFPWDEVWPAITADISTVLVVPNVTVRTESQHFIPFTSLYELLGKALPLPLQFPNKVFWRLYIF